MMHLRSPARLALGRITCRGLSTSADLASHWLARDPCETTRAQVEALLASNNSSALDALFQTPRLQFGTAGIRGAMGPGPGKMNDLMIIQTTQGLAAFLEQQLGSPASLAEPPRVARANFQRCPSPNTSGCPLPRRLRLCALCLAEDRASRSPLRRCAGRSDPRPYQGARV